MPVDQTTDARDAEIAALRETNRRLNLRANGMDAYWQRRAMKAELVLEWSRDHWKQEFDRAGAAFNELRDIYLMVEQARGRPRPVFHSVNDCCHPNPWQNPGIHANVYIDPVKGGVRHERVVDAVRDVLGLKERADAA